MSGTAGAERSRARTSGPRSGSNWTGTVSGGGLPGAARGGGPSGAPLPVPLSSRSITTREWPLQDFLELGALPSAVPCARLHSKQVVWEWGLAGLTDIIEILVSELVTNAVRAAQSIDQPSAVRLWLLSDKAQLVIIVWDASPQSPVRVNAAEDAERGRGLLLVEAISDQWGSFPTQDTGGKAVWAVVTP
jgi:anti-sigma regulatory factor (Ser/Thr protein kinase)